MKAKRICTYAALFVALEAVLIAFADHPLSDYLRTVDTQHHALINFFRAYTDAGLSKWYLWPAAGGIALCLLFVRMDFLSAKTRGRLAVAGHFLLFLFSSVALAGIVADIIKPFVGRARPVILQHEGIYGFHPFAFGNAAWNSFPSGHATTAFALAWVMMVLFPRATWLWLLFAVAVSISRVMVNAHFLSDVCAGALVGILVTIGLKWVFNRRRVISLLRRLFLIDARARSGLSAGPLGP